MNWTRPTPPIPRQVRSSATPVDVHADRSLIGRADGAAYVFVHAGGALAEEQRLTPSSGASGDGFGRAVALGANLALVAAPANDQVATDAGIVFGYLHTAGGWVEEATIVAPDAEAGDAFRKLPRPGRRHAAGWRATGRRARCRGCRIGLRLPAHRRNVELRGQAQGK